MKVYMIYKKSLYNKLSWIKKILYIISGGSKTDLLDAYTLDEHIARLYMIINKKPGLYLKKHDIGFDEYVIFNKKYKNLKIKRYLLTNGNEVILKAEEKDRYIKNGVEVYDSSK